MELIATHDSGTGEVSEGLLSYLVLPFAKTQSKTIMQQYDAGCRLFDFRVKYDKHGELVFAHGLWHSSVTLLDIIRKLSSKWQWKCNITYEGKLTTEESRNKFVADITEIMTYYGLISRLGDIAVKLPKWVILKHYHNYTFDYGFKTIYWFNWRCLLPIPWLWDKLCSRPHKFNNKSYTMVDFL